MRKFIGALFCFVAANCYAQQNNLNDLLVQQDYMSFETQLVKQYPMVDSQNKYLMTQVYSGHPIVYWMLANNYSKNIVASQYLYTNKENIEFTKYMIYTALILTEQDSLACQDQMVRGATREVLKKYPSTMDFERRYPYNNASIFDKSVVFTQTLRSRPSAKWICLDYGDERNATTYGKLWNLEETNRFRALAIENLGKKFK